MENNIIKMTSIADVVSLGNALSGLIAILFAVTGNFILSAKFLLLAVLFDSMDGFVARKTKKDLVDTIFGENIDSLSDVISFGVAPAVILYLITNSIWSLIPVLLLVACGVLRLTRYNTIAQKEKVHTNTFIGLPIPVSSTVLAALILSSITNTYILFIIMTIIALLMISSFVYPKIDNKTLLSIMGICFIVSLLPEFINELFFKIPSFIIIILTLIYTFTTPILSLLKK